MTGETGSGKSIIVGALKLILGERADKSLIRTGAESCTVEAVFHVGDAKALNARLEEQGVEPCEDGQLIVKRVFSAAGTNRQFINGSPTTLAVLKELGDGLVDLHGPHDHQSLLSDTKQLDLLDAFAGAGALREKYEEQYRALNALIAEHAELSTSEAALEREIDLLRHQVHEIEAAQLRPGRGGGTARALHRGIEQPPAAGAFHADRRAAHRSRGRAAPAAGRDWANCCAISNASIPRPSRFPTRTSRAVAELEDLAQSLQRYAEDLDLEPARLAQMEERVSLFETLKRKYGGSVAEVIAFGDRPRERLRKIESRGEELARLEREIAAARAGDARGRREARRRSATAAAPKLAASVTAHLRDLGFKKSDFARRARRAGEARPRTGWRASSSSSRRIPASRRSRSRPSPPAAKSRA